MVPWPLQKLGGDSPLYPQCPLCIHNVFIIIVHLIIRIIFIKDSCILIFSITRDFTLIITAISASIVFTVTSFIVTIFAVIVSTITVFTITVFTITLSTVTAFIVITKGFSFFIIFSIYPCFLRILQRMLTGFSIFFLLYLKDNYFLKSLIINNSLIIWLSILFLCNQAYFLSNPTANHINYLINFNYWPIKINFSYSHVISFTHTKCMQTVKTWSHDIFQSDGPIWELGISSWLLESEDHFYDMWCRFGESGISSRSLESQDHFYYM